MAGSLTIPQQAWNWATVPRETLADGITRQMINGERLIPLRSAAPDYYSAEFLLTKDRALVDLAQRALPFRILTPADFAGAG